MTADYPVAPTSVVRSRFHRIENNEIDSDEELERLLGLMDEYPERAFYLFAPSGGGYNDRIVAAEQLGLLKYLIEESCYYRHPNFDDYLQIVNPQSDWEREVASGAMYVRVTLALTKKGERHVAEDKNPFVLQPNFAGVGVDVPKAWRRIKAWWVSRK